MAVTVGTVCKLCFLICPTLRFGRVDFFSVCVKGNNLSCYRQLVAGFQLWRLRFDVRLVHVGSVTDQVTMRQIFPKCCVSSVSSVSIDQPLLHNHLSLTLIIICGQQHSQKLTVLPKLMLIYRYSTYMADLILQVL